MTLPKLVARIGVLQRRLNRIDARLARARETGKPCPESVYREQGEVLGELRAAEHQRSRMQEVKP